MEPIQFLQIWETISGFEVNPTGIFESKLIFLPTS